MFFVFVSGSRLTTISYVLCQSVLCQSVLCSSVNMCRVSFITTLLTKFYVTVCMLLTCGNHFARPHHFSRREVLTYNRTIEMHIPSQESVWLCICVRDINFTSVSTIFQQDFGTVSTGWYFLSFILLDIYYTHFKEQKNPTKNIILVKWMRIGKLRYELDLI